MMHSVTVLGSGNAFHEDGRKSSGLWIEREGHGPFLVDCGPSILAGRPDRTRPLNRLAHVFFTHLHGDHTFGWPFLLLQMSLGNEGPRSTPLTVVGPSGIRAHLDRLVELAYGELLRPFAASVNVMELPVAAAKGIDVGDGLELATYPMSHHPSSIGFRFDLKGSQLAISGDTAWCPELESLADDADLLVVECTSLAPGRAPHVSLEEIRGRRERLRAKRTLLVHLNDAVAVSLAQDPIPSVTAAYDGLVLDWEPAEQELAE